ncbi:MAG: chromosomal replication initiator DnaA [Alphaproteobacteria bacterium]|nr:MAG: chromosomal replication initiator DnaA [Alphaproteobacteria bacterium]
MSASQIPLKLPHKPSYDMADFIVSSSNEEAMALVESWPDWPLHAVALVGPAAAGKSHLGHAWAERAGAKPLSVDTDLAGLEPGTAYLVEDADTGRFPEATLFHLYNWARETGGSVLFTARLAPTLWKVRLPDLRSRLATLPVAKILPPDDQLLTVLFVKLFSDRQLQVDLSVIDYILPRIERSFDAAKALVALIDESALADKRKITRTLAKSCLEALSDR